MIRWGLWKYPIAENIINRWPLVCLDPLVLLCRSRATNVELPLNSPTRQGTRSELARDAFMADVKMADRNPINRRAQWPGAHDLVGRP